MEFHSHASARTEQRSERAARVDLTLDLDTFGALDAGRLHDDLNTRREQIRQKIFRAIADHVVPAVAQVTGQPLEHPESWKVSSQHQTHSSWLAPEVRHGQLATGHRMDLHFDFEADRAMNAATMLQLGREQVGMAVADSFVHSLDQDLFGKEVSSGRWQTKTGPDGARELEYEVTEAPAAANRELAVMAPAADRAGGTPAGRAADGTERREGMDSVAANESFLSRTRASVESAEECLRKYGCSVPALRQRAAKTEAHLKSVQGCLTEGLKRWQQAADAGRELEAANWRAIIASDTRIMERFTGELRELRQDLARWKWPGDAHSEAP